MAERGALSMTKSDHETHHPLKELTIQQEASIATRMTLAVYGLPFGSRYLYRKSHITAYKPYIIIYEDII